MAEVSKIPSDSLDDLSKEELVELVSDLQDRVTKLEGEKANQKAFNRTVAEKTGRFTYWLFAGPRLFSATKKASQQWFDFLESPVKEHWPKQASSVFLAALLSRLMKIGLISLFVALIPIGIIAFQTIILSKQNTLFEQQNERFDTQNEQIASQNSFVAFEQTTKFQELLFQSPLDAQGKRVNDYQAFPDSVDRWPAPNQAFVRQLISLGQKEHALVVEALRPLLGDKNSSVSAGALLTLRAIQDSLIAVDAQLSKANLYFADLERAELPYADLGGANLEEANLEGANLEEANLAGANLQFANLDDTNLEGANLNFAKLDYASFDGAWLEDATFDGAVLYGSNLSGSHGADIGRLCLASELRNFNDEALVAQIQSLCPEKLIPRE